MSQLSSPAISIVVMAYNEAGNLEAVAKEIHAVLMSLNRPFELLIVDDGSTDATGAAADSLSASLASTRVIHHPANQGLGGVYRTGFTQASGDFISFFPADGQFPATIIAQFLQAIAGADLVLGCLPNRRSSLLAKALSLAEKIVYGVLVGPLPKFQGVLMFRRELLQRFELKSKGRGWAVLMEFIIRSKRAGCRIVSVPTAMRPRMSGHSKVNNWRTIWANFTQVVGLRRYL